MVLQLAHQHAVERTLQPLTAVLGWPVHTDKSRCTEPPLERACKCRAPAEQLIGIVVRGTGSGRQFGGEKGAETIPVGTFCRCQICSHREAPYRCGCILHAPALRRGTLCLA